MTSSLYKARVLVVSGRFPPDGAVGTLRTLRLLKVLVPLGSDVQVLTISPSTYRQGTAVDAGRLGQVPSSVAVLHAPALRPIARLTGVLGRLRRAARRRPATQELGARSAPPRESFGGGSLRRAITALLTIPDHEVSWILPAVARGFLAARTSAPDVIYSSGPPYSAHIVASVLARVLRRPWVADFRDPWARAPWRDGRFGFEKRAWAVLERFVVRRATKVVFVTEANREDFATAHGEWLARRFHVVPNGCDLDDFAGIVRTATRDQFVLLHAGSLYGGRDPSALFRAVAKGIEAGTINRDRFRIRLIGRIGAVDVERTVQEFGVGDIVEVVPQMPRRDVLQEMVNASALLIVQPVTRLSIPAKLYEYLATGRPVLALAEPDGETAAVVRASQSGVVVNPQDENAILSALRTLIDRADEPATENSALYDGIVRARELAGLLADSLLANMRSRTKVKRPGVERAL